MIIGGSTRIAGVVGRPIAHSLSPLLHNTWLKAGEIDGAYVAFTTTEQRFSAFINGLRGGVIWGLNVTVPFKEQALALADRADQASQGAGAANLLLFHEDGSIEARNTDGVGLLAAFAEQVPMFHVEHGPVVILGAGGAARGAAAAVRAKGATDIRIVNRTFAKATDVAGLVGACAYAVEDAEQAFEGALAIINATSAGLMGDEPAWPLSAAPVSAIAMDMTYRPLTTRFLRAARERNLTTVDGLAMLIGQARPSFEAFYGVVSPTSVDARGLLLVALGEGR